MVVFAKSMAMAWDPVEYELAKENLVDEIVVNEGGYQDDYNDSGNWTGGEVGKGTLKGTNYGISAASYPTLDIKNLTIDEAKQIYRDDYLMAPEINYGKNRVAFKVADISVHAGAGNATLIVQRAINDLYGGELLVEDGKMNSDPDKGTLAAIRGAIEVIGEDGFIEYITNAQKEFYTEKIAADPKHKSGYKKGWNKRANWKPASR